MAQSITVNGNTYNDSPYDASSNPNGLANGGWRVSSKFITMLLDTIVDATTTLRTTSTTPLTIGTGPTGPLTLDQDVPLASGDFVLITDTVAPTTNWMVGQITNRTNDDITVDVSKIAGNGTLSSWTVQISAYPGNVGGVGPAGATGAIGASGTDGADGAPGTYTDTAAQLAIDNPTTTAGILYIETDTQRMKLGDGSTAFTSLLYLDNAENLNVWSPGGALTPSSGTITVDCSIYNEIHDIQPSGNDTINLTNVSATDSTVVRFRMTNGGAHTLAWQINSVAAASVTFVQTFVFTTSGQDDCLAEVDESGNVTIVRWRENI